mmetsp:Transcript_31349/g.66001  ORF Transcript_31349/g.66001 Transcript_31349/m.66001 type:complete len:136 (+) Transcript_31349:463-870(+)
MVHISWFFLAAIARYTNSPSCTDTLPRCIYLLMVENLSLRSDSSLGAREGDEWQIFASFAQFKDSATNSAQTKIYFPITRLHMDSTDYSILQIFSQRPRPSMDATSQFRYSSIGRRSDFSSLLVASPAGQPHRKY